MLISMIIFGIQFSNRNEDMGVFQSTVHFDNLTAVIDNHSSYEIKFRVSRLGQENNEKSTQTNETENQKLFSQSQSQESENLNYVYTGLVMPYSTKYYEFKDIEKEYRFSVYAISFDQDKKQVSIPLQNNLKIVSESTVSIRITSDLKVIHLNNEQIQSLKLRKEIQLIFLKHSDIIKSQELSHQLVKLFVDCPFKVKLLFRASQHNFDVKQFYNKFGLIESVLLICKTNNHKIIGGYSRQSFISPQLTNFDQNGWKNIRDQTKSSFIFSLSSNEVFPLKQGQNALFYNKNNEQICFGSDQLRINNHSDQKPCLTRNFNTNYENKNYNNDSESYKLFNGNQSPEFTTEQWEVWAIDLQEEAQQQEDSALLALAMDI